MQINIVRVPDGRGLPIALAVSFRYFMYHKGAVPCMNYFVLGFVQRIFLNDVRTVWPEVHHSFVGLARRYRKDKPKRNAT